MAILIFFRVNEKHFTDTLSYFSDKKCFIVQEVATNCHYHGVAEIDASTYEAAKKSFQRALTNKSNKRGGDGSHSCEPVGDTNADMHSIFRYCCKAASREDQPDIVYNNWKLDSKHIHLFHHQYWDTYCELTLDKPDKKKSTSDRPYINGVIKFMEKHKPGITKLGGFKKYKISEVQRADLIKVYTLAWYTQNVKTYPNGQQLTNMSNTVYSQILSRNYPEVAEDEEEQKFFRIALKFVHDYQLDYTRFFEDIRKVK